MYSEGKGRKLELSGVECACLGGEGDLRQEAVLQSSG